MPPTLIADAAAQTAGDENEAALDLDLNSLLYGDDSAGDDEESPVADPDNEDLDAEEAADDAAAQDEGSEDPAAEDTTADDSATEGDDPAGEDDPQAVLDEEGRKARASFTAGQQRIFDREIAKVKRKDREAREALERTTQEREQQLDTLRAQLQEAQTGQPAPVVTTLEQPLAGVDDEAALETRLDQARALRRWALRHPQGGVVQDDKGNEIEISEDRAATMLAESEDLIEKHGPARRSFLQARAQAKQMEAQAYPWLKDPKSPGSVAIEGALRRHPVLRELFPDVKLLLADMLLGQQVRQQAAQKQPAPAPKATAAPKTSSAPRAPASPTGGTRPPKVAGPEKRKRHATQSLVDTGEDPDNAALGALLAGG